MVTTIRKSLPFLIDLTTAERMSLAKFGDKSQAFVKKALDTATHSSNLLPQEFLVEMRKDAQLLDSLAPIRVAVDLLQKQIDDTAYQVGAEAYAGARTIYAVSKTPFAEATLRTAAEDLGKRFGRRTRATAAAVEPANSAPPPPSANNNA